MFSIITESDILNKDLVACETCGVVSAKYTIKHYERDENDNKIAYLECPNCNHKYEIPYNE